MKKALFKFALFLNSKIIVYACIFRQDRKRKILFWTKYNNINSYFDCTVASSSVKVWIS